MSTINVKFGNRNMALPKNSLDVRDITLIFNVQEEGLHIKVKEGEIWKNLLPQSNNLIPEALLPSGCTEALLIACEKVNSTPQSLQQAPVTSVISFTDRFQTISTASNNSGAYTAIGSRRGKRALPVPMKRLYEETKSNYVSTKRRKTNCYMKNISVTHVKSNGSLETVFDVPINITELGEKCPTFNVDNIQEEVKNQVGECSNFFIITDKKGHPIRNMQNTRGELIKLTLLHLLNAENIYIIPALLSILFLKIKILCLLIPCTALDWRMLA